MLSQNSCPVHFSECLGVDFLSVLDEVWSRPVNPICSSPPTLIAGFDLLVTMCTGCVQNMQYLSDVLCSMYYSGNVNVLPEWVTLWGLIVGSAIKLSDQVLHTVLYNLWSEALTWSLLTFWTPNILILILSSCPKDIVWIAFGELIESKQEITCQFLHTVPHAAGHKSKGEVCLWSAVGALRIKGLKCSCKGHNICHSSFISKLIPKKTSIVCFQNKLGWCQGWCIIARRKL